MCGIAGVQGDLTPPADDILKHRGPDAFGRHQAQATQLFHWRLSILDLSEAGDQPLSNETGTLRLVCNGEIYNFRDLRRELEGKGHRFASHSDNEALIHLYEEYGAAMLSRLRGMFAFALYDETRQELFLARDPFGIKPLVYTELPRGFAFASELRVLTAMPELPRELDPTAVELYFRLNYIPAPWTIWAHARKLRPGHYLRVREGRVVEEVRYARLTPQPWGGSVEDAQACLKSTLQESVRAHLIADVPVGAFLSGGLDSSLVTAMAQELAGAPLRTFTVSFPEIPRYDDPKYARIVAGALGTDHLEIPVTAAEAQRELESIVDHLDEPFADSSLVACAIVSRAARDHVKVALAGDGGDELFAGYTRYRGLQLSEAMRPATPFLKPLARLPLPERRGTRWGNRFRLFRKMIKLLAEAPERRVLSSIEVLSEDELRQIVDAPRGDDVIQPLVDRWLSEAQTIGLTGLDRVLYLDAHLGLPNDMLFKVDAASMFHSLEVRVPLVDVEVARLAFSLPSEWKVKSFEGKSILRKVAKDYLPQQVLARSKQGFAVPIGEWIRNGLRPLFRETLDPAQIRAGRLLNPGAVEHLFSEHLSERRDRFWELWSLFVFERWRARHLA